MSKIKEIERQIQETQDQMEDLNTIMQHLQQALEEEVKKDWRYSTDEIEFRCKDYEKDTTILVCSIFDSWMRTKKRFQDDSKVGVFLFEPSSHDGISMSIEDAKELIAYMQEKITYLEGE